MKMLAPTPPARKAHAKVSRKARSLSRFTQKSTPKEILCAACAVLRKGRQLFPHPIERAQWTSNALTELIVDAGISAPTDDFFSKADAFLRLAIAHRWERQLDAAEGGNHWTALAQARAHTHRPSSTGHVAQSEPC